MNGIEKTIEDYQAEKTEKEEQLERLTASESEVQRLRKQLPTEVAIEGHEEAKSANEQNTPALSGSSFGIFFAASSTCSRHKQDAESGLNESQEDADDSDGALLADSGSSAFLNMS